MLFSLLLLCEQNSNINETRFRCCSFDRDEWPCVKNKIANLIPQIYSDTWLWHCSYTCAMNPLFQMCFRNLIDMCERWMLSIFYVIASKKFLHAFYESLFHRSVSLHSEFTLMIVRQKLQKLEPRFRISQLESTQSGQTIILLFFVSLPTKWVTSFIDFFLFPLLNVSCLHQLYKR